MFNDNNLHSVNEARFDETDIGQNEANVRNIPNIRRRTENNIPETFSPTRSMIWTAVLGLTCLAVFGAGAVEIRDLRDLTALQGGIITQLRNQSDKTESGLGTMVTENATRDEKVDTLETNIGKMETFVTYMYANKGVISLSDTQFQATSSENFNVSIQNMDAHLSGIKVKGEMLNTTSVACQMCSFRIKVGTTEQDFTIKRITGGHATKFEVYVPNVSYYETDSAYISYVGGTISYRY